jgi:hypothetical protein
MTHTADAIRLDAVHLLFDFCDLLLQRALVLLSLACRVTKQHRRRYCADGQQQSQPPSRHRRGTSRLESARNISLVPIADDCLREVVMVG